MLSDNNSPNEAQRALTQDFFLDPLISIHLHKHFLLNWEKNYFTEQTLKHGGVLRHDKITYKIYYPRSLTARLDIASCTMVALSFRVVGDEDKEGVVIVRAIKQETKE